ncbi:MAG: GNAT family N-acetyltransferase [Muribaculaceae bacterium]|nr:GNAT family N-acetyltransferase [Muribaculaceae bacterium]
MDDTMILERTQQKNQSGESLRKEIKNMWKEVFDTTDEWLDMYFKRVYSQADLLTLTASDDDDEIVSSLLLQRYNMYFHSMPIAVGYISGAATRKQYRDRGYMKQLMHDAIVRSYDRGDVLLTLIPANRSLYFYYDRLGFSTVFYVDEERYTEKHEFAYDGIYESVEAKENHDVYQFMDEKLKELDNVILHSYIDFQNIIADAEADGGRVFALKDADEGKIAALAIAAPSDERLTVRELLYASEDARNAVLTRVMRAYPGLPMTIVMPAGRRSVPIHARGMARIINARKLLSAYAARYPKMKMAIRLYDSMIPQNNHIYVIDGGQAVINDGFGGKIDLDVTQEVLLSILSSDAPIGEIFNMPTARPYISMMMD